MTAAVRTCTNYQASSCITCIAIGVAHAMYHTFIRCQKTVSWYCTGIPEVHHQINTAHDPNGKNLWESAKVESISANVSSCIRILPVSKIMAIDIICLFVSNGYQSVACINIYQKLQAQQAVRLLYIWTKSHRQACQKTETLTHLSWTRYSVRIAGN